MNEELKKLFIDFLAKKGLEMQKCISRGGGGLFFYQPPTYDTRRAYTVEDVRRLTKEGFYVSENSGHFMFNLFYINI